MRYEVAASLTEQLQRETQAKVNLTGVQGIFPTVTKFGMAALLPHKKLSVELKTGKTERLAVLADGQSTEASNRDKLLKGADIHSVALQYKNIIGMKDFFPYNAKYYLPHQFGTAAESVLVLLEHLDVIVGKTYRTKPQCRENKQHHIYIRNVAQQ
jgi:hypothetical protein